MSYAYIDWWWGWGSDADKGERFTKQCMLEWWPVIALWGRLERKPPNISISASLSLSPFPFFSFLWGFRSATMELPHFLLLSVNTLLSALPKSQEEGLPIQGSVGHRVHRGMELLPSHKSHPSHIQNDLVKNGCNLRSQSQRHID